MLVVDEVEQALAGLSLVGGVPGELEAARLELQSGQPERCVERVTGLGAHPGAPALYLLALAHCRVGDLYRAEAALDAALHQDPDLDRASLLLARIYEAQEDPDRAARLLRSVLDRRPEQAAFEGALARCYNTLGQPRRAEAMARQGLATRPEDAQLRAALGDALRRQDRHEEALAVLSPLATHAAVTPEVLVALGRSLLALHHPSDARPLFERALAHDGDAVGALAGLAEVLESEGRLSEARGYVLRALAAAPDRARMHLLSARLHLAEGRLDGAARAADTAVQLAPADVAVLRMALAVTRARSRWSRAAGLAEEILRHAPEDAEAWATVWVQRALDGDAAGAEGALTTLAEANPQSPDVHLALGAARLAQDRIDAAGPALLEAVRLRTEDRLAAALLTLVYDPQPQAPLRQAALRRVLDGRARETDVASIPPVEAAVNALLGEPTGRSQSGPVALVHLTPMPRPITSSLPALHTLEPDRLESGNPSPDNLLGALARLHGLLDPPGGIGPRLSDLRARVDHLVEAQDQPVSLALLGAPGAGRTTLLQALVGRPVLPPQSQRLHVLRYGRVAGLRCIHRDGRVESRPLAAPDPADPVWQPDALRRVELLVPIEELARVTVVDRPSGADGPPPDAAVWVVGLDQPRGAWDEAQAWLGRNPVATLAVVTHHGDPVRAAAQATNVARWLGDGVAAVVAVDPHAGLAALAAGDRKALRDSGLPRFMGALRSHLVDQADALRARALARRAEHVRREALERAEVWLGGVESSARALDALGGRLSLDRARLRHHLESAWPDRLRAGLHTACGQQAGELSRLRGTTGPERIRAVAAFRLRLQASMRLAVEEARNELHERLGRLAQGWFEVLSRTHRGDEATMLRARLPNLEAEVGLRIRLALAAGPEQVRARVDGWLAQVPLDGWLSQATDAAARLWTALDLEHALPPLDPGLVAGLFEAVSTFVDEAAGDARVARMEVGQAVVEPLQRLRLAL